MYCFVFLIKTSAHFPFNLPISHLADGQSTNAVDALALRLRSQSRLRIQHTRFLPIRTPTLPIDIAERDCHQLEYPHSFTISSYLTHTFCSILVLITSANRINTHVPTLLKSRQLWPKISSPSCVCARRLKPIPLLPSLNLSLART